MPTGITGSGALPASVGPEAMYPPAQTRDHARLRDAHRLQGKKRRRPVFDFPKMME